MPSTRTRPPQLLVASHNHGAGSELLQLAERRGYTVRRAPTGAQLLEQAHAAPPDLVVLDESLTDMDALAASRALRDDPHVGPGTPLLLISAQRPSSPQHHAALRAGVWEFLRHPFNAEEIAAKLDTYVLLKLDSDRARRDTSVADAAGFYTVRGLALRAQELTLQAFHHAQPLACVALAPVTLDGQNAGAVDLLADVLRATGRRSDAIGRVGPGEFAVIAPGTDRGGAVLLAERLARAVATAGAGAGAGAGGPASGARAPGLRAGYDAVGNARYTPIEPKNLLSRATTALRAAKGQGAPNWIQGFGG
jgi:PleD family two-component response regulator